MQATRHYANEIFGINPEDGGLAVGGAEAIEQQIEDETVTTRSLEVVGEPQVITYNTLVLPLLQLTATKEQAGSFHDAAARLIYPRPKRPSKDKLVRPPTIFEEIEREGLHHDVPRQDHIVIHCKDLLATQPPHKSGIELALVPDPYESTTRLFYAEHAVCIDALRRMVRFQDKLSWESRYMPLIPIALLPIDAQPQQAAALEAEIRKELPARLVIGSVANPFVP